jgi:hypothetical protein
MAALIRYCFGIDPYSLTEEKFQKLAVEALFIMDFERQQMEVAIDNVLRNIRSTS